MLSDCTIREWRAGQEKLSALNPLSEYASKAETGTSLTSAGCFCAGMGTESAASDFDNK